jgi:hypothetical protein
MTGEPPAIATSPLDCHPLDAMLGLRGVTVGAHRAHAQACSGRLADVSAVRAKSGIRLNRRGSVLVSVGGSCPQIAVEAEAHDGDDRHDEGFHDRSLLGPGVVTADDSHHPSAVVAAYT